LEITSHFLKIFLRAVLEVRGNVILFIPTKQYVSGEVTFLYKTRQSYIKPFTNVTNLFSEKVIFVKKKLFVRMCVVALLLRGSRFQFVSIGTTVSTTIKREQPKIGTILFSD